MAAWTALDNDLIRSPLLTVYEKAIYNVIKSHLNGAGAAWPSMITIAAEANCSRTQVTRALAQLVTAGYISAVSRGKGRVNIYIISTPQVQVQEEPVPDRDTGSTPQVLGSTPQVLQPVPDRDTNYTKGRRTKKKNQEEEARVISPENLAKLFEVFSPIWGKAGVEERIAECLAYPFARTTKRDWYLTTRKWLRDESERRRGNNGQYPSNPSSQSTKRTRPATREYWEQYQREHPEIGVQP